MIKKVNAYYIFAVIFVLYYIPRYIEYTTFIKIDEIKLIVTFTKLISYMLAFSYIVYKIVQKKSISLLLSTIMFFFLFQSFLGERKSVFVVLLFSTIFEEEYMDKYIRSLFNISVVLYVITFISSKAGIIENVITSRDKLGGAWIAGGNGFEYPGQMIMMLMPIVFMYYYLKSGKITWKDNVFWLVVDAFIFSQCLTITGTVMIALFIACYNVLQYTKKTKDSKILASGIIKFLPFIFLFITIILLVIYKVFPLMGNILDKALNGRLNIGNIIIKSYGIKILGTNFTNGINNGYYEILDSEYMHMLVAEGILFLIVALILCCFVLKYTQLINNQYLTLIWIFILLNSIVNNGIFNLVFNPFSILITLYIRKNLNNAYLKEKFNKFKRTIKEE